MKKNITIVLLIITLTLAVWRREAPEPPIPSRFELQRILNARGHNLTVDGKIGDKTIQAWDEQVAVEYLKPWYKEME